MGALFSYSIYSSIILIALYLTYKWVLAGENQHRFNRAVIWMIYVVALAAPALAALMANLTTPVNASAADMAMNSPEISFDAEMPMATFDVAGSNPAGNTLANALLAIYIAGMAIVTLHTVIVAIRLSRLIKGGESRKHGDYTLVILDDRKAVAPFSWCSYVVMGRTDYEKWGEMILTHERQHLRKRHWVDMLLAQVVAIVQWYNPAAWLMREELKTVHEYQADSAVLGTGVEARQYQMLLIKKAVGARFPSLANSLNHSKLKKRVTMMYKSQSSVGSRLRAFSLVPVLALALLAGKIPAVANALSATADAEVALTAGKVTEKPAEKQPATLAGTVAGIRTAAKDAASGEDYGVVADDVKVVAYGTQKKGDDAPLTIKLAEMPGENVRYTVNGVEVGRDVALALDPKCIAEVSVDKTETPTVAITLKPEGEQKMREVHHLSSTDNIKSATHKKDIVVYLDDKEIPMEQMEKISTDKIESITVMKANEENGRDKDAIYVTLKKNNPETGDKVFSQVEQMPRYEGGESAMLKFLADNVKYPEKAKKENTQGRVIVQFTVTKDGKVADPKAIRSVSPEIDAEALRVVNLLDLWTPGKVNGEPVDCRYTLPVSFKLQGDNTENPDAQK